MTRPQGFLLGAGIAGLAALREATRRHRRVSFQGRPVLLVGGSRGLGLVVARRLAAEGALLTLAARDAAELERARADLETQGAPSLATVVCDISRPDEAEQLVRSVIERHGRIDVLINNAGVIKVGPLEHMLPADFEEAMAVHFRGPLHTMRAAIPAMQAQRFGRIVNVTSIGGKLAVPHLAPYSASKFALAGLSDAVRAEVRRHNIYVTTVVPGLMRTGSPFNAWFKGRHREEFRWFSISDSLPVMSMSAERAARQLIEACRQGRAHCVLGGLAQLVLWAQALAPSVTAELVALANDLILPGHGRTSDVAHSGWQSASSWSPSAITRLTDRAAEANNELPAR